MGQTGRGTADGQRDARTCPPRGWRRGSWAAAHLSWHCARRWKDLRLLMEGRRRKARGTGVMVGFVETYNRPLTIQAIGDLEVIPHKKIQYKGVVLEEMDTDAVIRRKPGVALVDELAHTNAPGAKHEKRCQDVQELLDSGITVIGTVNVQHLESLADIVESITGVPIRERIPDRVIDEADEVELVDMSPQDR